MLPNRKHTHLPGIDYADKDHVYFVTVCCSNKKPHLKNASLSEKLVDALVYYQAEGKATIYCYCLMYDHMHLVMSIGDNYGKDLAALVAAIKRYTSKIASDDFGISNLWQKNFYEHIVRQHDSLYDICQYVLNNPVRKDMACCWEEYPFADIMKPPPTI